MRTHPESEIKQVLAHYDLGEMVAYEINSRGYVNTSYFLETIGKTGRHRFFLRKYKTGIQEEELKFEHSLIDHLVAKEFEPVAKIFRTKDNHSYVKRYEYERRICEYYAIFEFLKGEDKYTWINPICSSEEIMNSASVLARYHAAVHGFTPEGKRTEPKVIDLLPLIKKNLVEFQKKGKQTRFDAYLSENLALILNSIARTLADLDKQDPKEFVHLVIHCDYHPGNLKFLEEEVIGLFDFDWSKIDLRCFDVALALMYFFTSWRDGSHGQLRLEEVAAFVETYQNTLAGNAGLGPLSSAELSCLPDLIIASDLYILYWTIQDYYHKDVDPDEYLAYLRHCVEAVKFLEQGDQRSRLEAVLSAYQPQSLRK